MVLIGGIKRQKKHIAKRGMNQGQNDDHPESAKISPNTRYEQYAPALPGITAYRV